MAHPAWARRKKYSSQKYDTSPNFPTYAHIMYVPAAGINQRLRVVPLNVIFVNSLSLLELVAYRSDICLGVVPAFAFAILQYCNRKNTNPIPSVRTNLARRAHTRFSIFPPRTPFRPGHVTSMTKLTNRFDQILRQTLSLDAL